MEYCKASSYAAAHFAPVDTDAGLRDRISAMRRWGQCGFCAIAACRGRGKMWAPYWDGRTVSNEKDLGR
jgi:hypothetical protein